jgi:hypothetical protein
MYRIGQGRDFLPMRVEFLVQTQYARVCNQQVIRYTGQFAQPGAGDNPYSAPAAPGNGNNESFVGTGNAS